MYTSFALVLMLSACQEKDDTNPLDDTGLIDTENDTDTDADTDTDTDTDADTDADSDADADADTDTDTDTVIDADNDGVPAEDDCDDDDASVGGKTSFYVDADSDGYGDPDASLQACSGPSGTVADGTDCDDLDAEVNPGAEEVCDDIDNDCDLDIDDEDNDVVDSAVWYEDDDKDGFGNDDVSAGISACDQPSDHVSNHEDCDDGDIDVNPDGIEVCDGNVDNDCDGLADDDAGSGVTDPETWYEDDDEDGYGTPSSTSEACDAPSGYVDNYDDCDDGDKDVFDSCGARDGTYTGTVSVTATETTSGLSDTCTGGIALDVVETDSPQISGVGTCTFSGAFSGLLGTVSTSLEGNIDTDPDCSGDIDIGGLTAAPWTGQFTSTTNLSGDAEGTLTYGMFTLDYTGTFSADL